MLWADKRALETNLKLSLLQIRERELNFYTNNCLAIATQSALLAGFAYAALMPGISLGDANGVAAHSYPVRLMYLVCAVSALGLQLITVVSCVDAYAPGLRTARTGSMHMSMHMRMHMHVHQPPACCTCRRQGSLPPGPHNVRTRYAYQPQACRAQHAVCTVRRTVRRERGWRARHTTLPSMLEAATLCRWSAPHCSRCSAPGSRYVARTAPWHKLVR